MPFDLDPIEGSEGSSGSGTIRIADPEAYPLSGATLTLLKRLDTNIELTLPSPADFVYDSDSATWELDVDLSDVPADVDVYWEADLTYEAGGTSGADGVIQGNGDATTFNLFGTRAGMELKCNGPKNLELYEFQPGNGNTRDSEAGQAQIAESIQDDLEEANADMAAAWRKGTVKIAAMRGITFVRVPLGYKEAYEFRWLNDTAEYGGVSKAWGGRNVSRGNTDDVPEQIATALGEWQLRLAALEAGTELLDYYDDYTDTEYTDQEPVGTFQSVPLTFNDDGGVVDEFSEN